MSRMKKAPYHSMCTVKRTFKRVHSTINMATGAKKKGRTEVVTEACNTPLFAVDEHVSGVCRACATGWEVKDNRFASKKERERAAVYAPKSGQGS